MKLEQFFLRTVALYLHTIEDLLNFTLMNKHSQQILCTMHINTYRTTQNTNLNQILKFFPLLETIYISSIVNNVDKELIKKVTFFEINYNNQMDFDSILQDDGAQQKVRKLTLRNYNSKFLPFTSLTQLRELTIYGLASYIDVINLSRLISSPSLKKVILYVTLYEASSIIKSFPFKEHYNTEYSIVMKNVTHHGEPPEFNTFNLHLPNVTFYVSFLSSLAFDNNIDFLPLRDGLSASTHIVMMKDMNDKETLIDKMMVKSFAEDLHLTYFWGQTKEPLYHQSTSQTYRFDFGSINTVKQLLMTGVIGCHVIVADTPQMMYDTSWIDKRYCQNTHIDVRNNYIEMNKTVDPKDKRKQIQHKIKHPFNDSFNSSTLKLNHTISQIPFKRGEMLQESAV
ncbi:hypothetical protein EIN_018290 [Entamoeba invadens IP1]|uniref:hypothetical protein n=1 Tax=Entamoeba invadens IP1 TaxID=370355 RepID=UPI0002C3E9DA|nr:hypothetical protein EIN_018290 [Entamoeba invadens IP1]ELP90480.1 hypothetical protein EIN_018290 [Entamoeba invadens IP1]|eukprot:XP_004257251.1 hypothetical protein EIN_018290 [Entamoeba invadens IP1]